LFRGADGRFHARVAVNGRYEVYGLKSSAFRDWLTDAYVSAYQAMPPQRAMYSVLRTLEARARFQVDMPPVYLRVALGEDDAGRARHYLDLGDATGRAVEIGAGTWSVVEKPGVQFSRPPGLLPLPVPSGDGSIELLRPFVNLAEADFQLLVAWMAAALLPAGPYPVLVIHGEQGSAKSTLAKIVRQLIDPQAAPVLRQPQSTQNLMVTAMNGWLLVYDNISTLPDWLSDGLCQVASGGGLSTRALFSNDDRNVIYVQRPVMLSGIPEFVRKEDLADRAVVLRLPGIARENRREEREFWPAFCDLQPQIVGALLGAVAGGLRELPSVKLLALPRMADFARFGEAVGRGLGWKPGTFISAYEENRRASADEVLGESLVAAEILEVVELEDGPLEWTDSPSDMFDELNARKSRRERAVPGWPKTPAALGKELSRIAPQLRELGVHVTFAKTKESRLITITTKPPKRQPN
jgi:hypothetical protein